MEGKSQDSGFNGKFLESQGFEKVSKIAMHENSFMTKSAWLELTPKNMEGYWNMPAVFDNPQWRMTEIFDGFVSHISNLG